MGTSMLAGGQSSMYNYTAILGDERSSLQVRCFVLFCVPFPSMPRARFDQLTTDPAFNIHGEVRTMLDPRLTAKVSLAVSPSTSPVRHLNSKLDFSASAWKRARS